MEQKQRFEELERPCYLNPTSNLMMKGCVFGFAVAMLMASCSKERNYELVSVSIIDYVFPKEPNFQIIRSSSDYSNLDGAIKAKLDGVESIDFGDSFMLLYGGARITGVQSLRDMTIVKVSREVVTGTSVAHIKGDSSPHVLFTFESKR